MAYRDPEKRRAAGRRYYERTKETRREKRRAWYKAWAARNVEHLRESQRARNARNKERYAVVTRNNNLRKKYGIGVEEYQTMLLAQNGGCAICGRPDGGTARSKHLLVDHNHSTGLVRGLLCHACNIAVGAIEGRREYVRQIEAYLE